MRRLLSWLDKNFLAVLAGFLIVFIPLYPKWPLFDILPGYVVRVRLEDFLVGLAFFVYVIQLLRKKIRLEKDLVTVCFGAYLVIGLLSIVTSIFLIQSIPLEYLQIAKAGLHWLRRLEYFSLFLILFSTIKNLRTIRIYVLIILSTLVLVILYGYGQKYLYWPAFSTMNREYSKGWWLYLTEHSRVLSTFGGHYDLAGYLVITLSLAWGLFFGLKKLWQKAILAFIIINGFWLLILTASRISFGAYLLSVTVIIFFWMFRKSTPWAISRWLIVILLSISLMLAFGDLSDRFLKLFRISDRVANLQNILLHPATKAPTSQAAFLVNNTNDPTAAVTSLSDTPPLPRRPSDVSAANNEPLQVTVQTASGSATESRARTYSQNALTYDLSTAIRLDVTWPRAIAGFKADPILGQGYGTLSRENKFDFTLGESTDNDFLRALGETGILGFLGFFGTIGLMALVAIRSLGGIKDDFLYGLSVGFVGLIGGLFVNALLIDIFEASKVAYAFWAVSGVCMGALYLKREEIKENYQSLNILNYLRDVGIMFKKLLSTDRALVLILVGLSLTLRLYKLETPLADWHSWRQADTSAVTRNFVKNDNIDLLYPKYDDISSLQTGRPNPVGYRFVEFPFYNAVTAITRQLLPELTVEQAGRFVTACFYSLAVLFLFFLGKKLFNKRTGFLAALVMAVVPYGIFYGRTILPDPTMVSLSLGALAFLAYYLDRQKISYLIVSLLLAILALLVKPFAIFLLLPAIYLWMAKYGFSLRKWPLLFAYFVIAAVPLILWRLWIGHYPEGIPASDWLLNGNGIRFKGAFWYWLFADRLGRLILGYWGLGLLLLGIIRRLDGKFRLFPLVLGLCSFAYLAVFATGNVQHDYYQILLLPAVSLFVGLGLDFLLFNPPAVFNRQISRIFAILCLVAMCGFGWYFVRDYYNINHPEIVEAGSRFQVFVKNPDALVIAPYDGDTAFLYQTDHKGWPIMEGSIDDMIKKGADYYVSVRFDQTTLDILKEAVGHAKLPLVYKKPYKIIEQTDKYVIVQLVADYNLPRY